MLRVQLDVQDQFSPELARFGKRAPTIALRICRTIGQEYRKFLKKHYLRGQVIGKRTGTLYKSIKIKSDKESKNAVTVIPGPLANIYHNPSGATIKRDKAKALRFVNKEGEVVFTKKPIHLKPRPFMTDSKRDFPWRTEIPKAATRVIEREIKKLEAKQRGAG